MTGFVVAYRGSVGKPVRYVPRVFTSRTEAERARAELLRWYPPTSEWHTELFVSAWPPLRRVK